MAEPLKKLPIDAELEGPFAEEDVARLWQRLDTSLAARRAKRTPPTVAIWAVATALGGIVAWWGGTHLATSHPPGPLARAAADTVLEATLAQGTVALDDGSRITVEPASELEVLANDERRFVTALRRGKCRFSVKPGGPRRWTIETDVATVEVIGTVFSVARTDHTFEVEVTRGVVLVRGERIEGRARRLTRGERLVVDVGPPDSAAHAAPLKAATDGSGEPRASDVASTAGSSAEGEPSPVGPTAEGDRRAEGVVRGGSGRAAVHGPEGRPGDGASGEPGPMLARFERAEAALRAGQIERAVTLFESLSRQPGAAGAVAAFELGRVEMERLDMPLAAARHFLRAADPSAPRALVEDAHARAIEALVRAGRLEEATRRARDHATRFPNGHRLDDVRRMMDAPR